ncbi:hypothetical protein F7230_08430 [Corynebacterium sp. 320]|uniref:hypothetical protein n=1 Tax=Corynebacterium TaxID=1716 RepID=UPI00125CC3E5|nr:MULTISPECIES: hypothetical protein [Corynebacterium]KAB1502453.1 hypothetical protein F7230_08430 [Corynebacterium sp. 320]KAB1551326.1 hypothetical protein F7233_07350 [Corynebacterium sp. 321]KAB1551846.1 hypothetical protein F7232_06920 [Corynebacterium sp. 319]KAB3526060.1 hypothetical protein F8354_08430 [Corynebacterium sp. 250]KAB3538840.1 hypothetical protein F8390_07500 [Corynebacterium sp. 366]
MNTDARKPWILWCVAQVINLGVTGLWGLSVDDVHYYHRGLNDPWHGSLSEYPDASLWPLRLLEMMSNHSTSTFTWLFLLFNVGISGLFMLYFSKHPSRDGALRAAWFWAAFNVCMGPLILTRLDLAVGLVVACFIAMLSTRWGSLAPALLAYATMMKLSPGVIAVSLVGRMTESKTWMRVGIFVASLGAIAALTLSHADVDRLLSPLSYQDVRGLQVESVAASPFVLAAALTDGQWTVAWSPSKSYEITGPGVTTALAFTNALMLLTIVAALVLALAQFFRSANSRMRGWSVDYVMHATLSIMMALLVANKVFSPQYLMWVAPIVALLLARENRPRLARGFLGTALLSAVIFPYAYLELTDGPALWIALVLCVRNALVVYTCYVCVRNLLAFMFPNSRTIPFDAEPHPRPATVS